MGRIRHTQSRDIAGIATIWLIGLALLAALLSTMPVVRSAAVLWIVLFPALVLTGAAETIDAGLRSTLIVRRIRRAIKNDELFLVYQPKVDLLTGEVRGAEALVRWRHPRKGMVSPNDFIPHIESSWLSERFNSHVIGIAIDQAAEWRRDGLPIRVAVNVSPQALGPRLVEEIRDLLDDRGLPARLLELELTERGENDLDVDLDTCADALDSLKRLGVAISLDDFGTGQSSLSRLVALPVDYVKIDHSFVIPMLDDPMRLQIVRSVIGLVQGAGFKVIAEGVESERHAIRLREIGADIAQGYHVARPMPADDLVAWIDRRAGLVEIPDLATVRTSRLLPAPANAPAPSFSSRMVIQA